MLKDHPSNIFLSVVAAGGIGPGGMSDIQYYLAGTDIRRLAEYSDKLVAKAKTVPGLPILTVLCVPANRKYSWTSTGTSLPISAFGPECPAGAQHTGCRADSRYIQCR